MIDSSPNGRQTSPRPREARPGGAGTRQAPGTAATERFSPQLSGTGIEREFAERIEFEDKLQRQAECWRDEVASRVEGYRTRRSKKTLAGEFSMKFDFEPRAAALTAAGANPALAGDPVLGAAQQRASAEPEYEPEPEPECQQSPAEETVPEPAAAGEETSASWSRAASAMDDVTDPAEASISIPAQTNPAPAWVAAEGPARTLSSAKAALDGYLRNSRPAPPSRVIEFPRSLLFPEATPPVAADPYELAEPMLEKPRILDVPETVAVPASPLAGVALQQEEAAYEDEMAPPPSFELPLQVAPLYRRIAAALADWMLVLAATAGFGIIATRGVGSMALTKPVLALGVAVPVVFWSIYQYLFLVHAARTPGMQMARLCVSTFEGRAAGRMRRRWRALVLMLSCASLGFGFLWVLFDEDNLCWHDKATRTYLTAARHEAEAGQ